MGHGSWTDLCFAWDEHATILPGSKQRKPVPVDVSMRIRFLTGADVRAAISMPEAIEAMADAFGQLSDGRARVPLRIHQETDSGVTLLMSAYLPDAQDVGVKIASVYPDNVQQRLPLIHALIVLLDSRTGAPSALMDGAYLTALRTGAATGLATRLLARENAAVVALFGAGAQARTQLEAVRAVREIREVRLVSRTPQSARHLAAELSDVEVRVMENRSSAVRGADIVIAATNSSSPVFDGRDVGPGTHINGIGSYAPTMQEVDVTTLQGCKIVVDSREAALREAGDLIVPIREGRLTPEDIAAELGEIVNGQKPGRISDAEITFFKSVGNAAQDTAVANRVLATAEARGLGSCFEM